MPQVYNPRSRSRNFSKSGAQIIWNHTVRAAGIFHAAVAACDAVAPVGRALRPRRRSRPTARRWASSRSLALSVCARGGGGFMCGGGGFVCDAAARVWRVLLRRVRMAVQRLGFCGGGGRSWRREAASLAAAQGRGRPRHRAPTCQRGCVGLAQSRPSEGEVSENWVFFSFFNFNYSYMYDVCIYRNQ